MKSLSKISIESILKNTEFESLVDKFNISGETDMQKIFFLNNKGTLLEFLKNIEKDDDKRLRLYSLLKSQLDTFDKKLGATVLKIYIPIMVAFFVICLFSFRSCLLGSNKSDSNEPTILKECKTVEEAEKRMDWLITGYVEEYNKYCGLPKNSTTVEKYKDLGYILMDIFDCGKKCENLEYTDQHKVTDYAIKILKEHPDLYKLMDTGKIACWGE